MKKRCVKVRWHCSCMPSPSGVTPQQMEIIRLRTKGYQTNEIAQMQNTSLYHVNTLLDNARFIVVELCRDA